MSRRLRAFASIVLMLAGVCATARADELIVVTPPEASAPSDRARELFDEGVRLAETSDFAAALSAFEGSFALFPRASTAYNLAWVLHSTGRGRDAFMALQRAQPLEMTADERRAVETLRALVLRSVAVITVRVSPSDATLCIDDVCETGTDERRTFVVDENTHRVRAYATGHVAIELDVFATTGVEQRVALTLIPDSVVTPEDVARDSNQDETIGPLDAPAPNRRARRAKRIGIISASAVVAIGTIVAVVLTRPNEPYAGTLFGN